MTCSDCKYFRRYNGRPYCDLKGRDACGSDSQCDSYKNWSY